MTNITISVDDEYADVITFTLLGHSHIGFETITNIFCDVEQITDGMTILCKKNENGKIRVDVKQKGDGGDTE